MTSRSLKRIFSSKGKILLAFAAMLVLFAACKKDDKPGVDNSIAFEHQTYDIPVGTDEIVMSIVSEATAAVNITVPIVFSGSAVKGTDYTVSSEAITIVAGSKKAAITVKLNPSFGRESNIKVGLGTLPPGTKKGNVSSAVIGIPETALLIYSFSAQNYTMTTTAEVEMELKKTTGSFTAEKELKIPVVVDPSSTAVEGTHFEFVDGKNVVVPIGKSKGVVNIKFLKQEAGKDLIVLKVGGVGAHFVAGNYEQTKVVVFGPIYSQLEGTWQYKKITNYQWWVENMGWVNDDLTLIPGNAAVGGILTIGDGGLTPELTGGLKNYFRNSAITYIKEEDEYYQEAGGLKPPVEKIAIVSVFANVAFSANTKVERQAKLGLRVFQEAGKSILEVTIIDYEPTEFLQETFAEYKTYGGDPYMRSMPLRYHFEKVVQ